jgi:hypothetical protein
MNEMDITQTISGDEGVYHGLSVGGGLAWWRASPARRGRQVRPYGRLRAGAPAITEGATPLSASSTGSSDSVGLAWDLKALDWRVETGAR